MCWLFFLIVFRLYQFYYSYAVYYVQFYGRRWFACHVPRRGTLSLSFVSLSWLNIFSCTLALFKMPVDRLWVVNIGRWNCCKGFHFCTKFIKLNINGQSFNALWTMHCVCHFMELCISFCQLKRKLMGNMGAVKAAVAFGGFRSGATFQHNAAGISESTVVPTEVTHHASRVYKLALGCLFFSFKFRACARVCLVVSIWMFEY